MEKREVTSFAGSAGVLAAALCSSDVCFAQSSTVQEILADTSKFRMLIPMVALVLLGTIALLFIVFVAARLKKTRTVVDIPDFSFEATETIRIDVNGVIKGSKEEDEGTVVLMPGFFRIVQGPEEVTGQEFRITSNMTKIGREESSVDKSRGWIVLPRACTTVSRYQADLSYEEGNYYVYHRSLSTETTVNGVPVSSKEPRKLAENDLISFGGIGLTYVRDAAGPARRDTAATGALAK